MSSARSSDGTAYEVVGDGAPVVLIHGLGLARAMWRDHLPALAASHRVLLYDLYGHGESAPAPEPVTLSLLAQQVAGVMDHAGWDAAHVVGFSIGGMINRRFVLDFPERTMSLAILNSPHDRGKGQRAVEERAQRVRDGGAMATFDDALARWFTPEHLAHGDGPARVREWREQVDEASYADTAWVLAHGVRELIRPDPPIAAPSLVMTCENDSGSTPAMSKAIADEIAGAELHVVPRLRHLGLVEEPALFTVPLIDFLEQAT